jgi:hypothetical protein
MGMTWSKVRNVTCAVVMVGALAMASGANFLDFLWNFVW